MNIHLAGIGWVTPMGVELDSVWQAICRKRHLEPKTLTTPSSQASFPYLPITDDFMAGTQAIARLRRSSLISHLAVNAALRAIKDSGLEWTETIAARSAMVFAVSDGSVLYTRRFFEVIDREGTQAGSPLLFPETVYNAPASHVAAHLKITGRCETLVNDATCALGALDLAQELLFDTEIDYCLVVAAEECDWIVAEGYNRWGLIPRYEQAKTPALADGAAALLLSKSGHGPCLGRSVSAPFRSRRDAELALRKVLQELRPSSSDTIIASGAGNRFEPIENSALHSAGLEQPVVRPRHTIGESLCAASLMQVACGGLSIRSGAPAALITVLGYNGLAAGLRLTSAERGS